MATGHEQTHSPEQHRTLRRAFAASLSGTALEWYDFALFGAVTATVFGKLFFDGSDPAVDTVKAFMTYGAGYLARPVGGVVFGRLGDQIGRKKVLVWTLLLIGLATFAIALLPTYAQAGVWAPILLVTMRFLQGVGVGGEWGGAVPLSGEFARPGTRGLWSSAAQTGVPLGSFLANGVLVVMTGLMSPEAFLTWGWRAAFALSLVLVGIGLWIRSRVEETPVFQRLSAHDETPRAPVSEVVRTHRRAVIGAVLTRVGPDVFYAFFAVYVIAWLQQGPGRLTNAEALTCTMTAGLVQVFVMPLAGWWSDRVGRRRLYAVAAVAGAVWAFVFVTAWEGGRSFPFAVTGVVVALVCHACMYGPQAAHIAEQFPARLRYTGSSLGYTLAGIIAGGPAPAVFAMLGAAGHGSGWIAAYIAVACAFTLVGLSMARTVPDTSDTALCDLDPARTGSSQQPRVR